MSRLDDALSVDAVDPGSIDAVKGDGFSPYIVAVEAGGDAEMLRGEDGASFVDRRQGPADLLGRAESYARRAAGRRNILAEAADLHENYVSRLETGEQEPGLFVLLRLSAAFSIGPGDLLGVVRGQPPGA